MGNHRLRADLLLLLAAAIWGFAFVAQRVGMRHLGPLTFNGVRFALGAAVLLPWMLRSGVFRGAAVLRGGSRGRESEFPDSPAAPSKCRGVPRGRQDALSASSRPPSPREILYGGLAAGVVLFGGATFQQWGVMLTTAGKAGFITGLYVVLTPLLGLVVGQRAPRASWIGAAIATAGLYLLSVRGGWQVGAGDLLVLVGAFFWAAHMLLVGWLARRLPPAFLAGLQFAVCSGLSLLGGALFETWSVAALRAAAIPILYAGLLSVGVAYTLQVVAQREAPPTHAAIILSLETVFAALGGWLLLAERLSARGLVGCALMLAGMLVSQLVRPRVRV